MDRTNLPPHIPPHQPASPPTAPSHPAPQIAGKRWKVDLQSQQQGSLLLSAVNLPGGVQRRRNAEDEAAMRSVFREGDLISVSHCLSHCFVWM